MTKHQAFIAYLRLLLDTGDALQFGEDSPEASAARDKSDGGAWGKLDDQSRELVRQVSEELNRLEDQA